MKKLFSLLLALCLLLPCASLGETAESAESEKPTLHDIQYYFQHKLLPNEFYNNAEQLLPFLRENGLYTMWHNFSTANGWDDVYTPEYFTMTEYPRDDGLFLMLLTFPRPESDLLCSRIWLCQDPETGRAGIFTVEYDGFMGETWFLCGWTPKGSHKNYGGAWPMVDLADPASREALDGEIDQVIQLFRAGEPSDAPEE